MKNSCILGILPGLDKTDRSIHKDAELACQGAVESSRMYLSVRWEWKRVHYTLDKKDTQNIVSAIRALSPIAIFVYGDQLTLGVMALVAKVFHGQYPVISTACSSSFDCAWFFGFRFWPDMGVLEWALLRMASEIDFHNYAILYVDTNYGRELAGRLKLRLRSANCTCSEKYEAVVSTDLQMSLANLKGIQNADIVFLIGYGDRYTLILRYLNEVAVESGKSGMRVITDKFVTEFSHEFDKNFPELRIAGLGITTQDSAIRVFAEEASLFLNRAIASIRVKTPDRLISQLCATEFCETRFGHLMVNPFGETSIHPYGAKISSEPPLYPLVPERSSIARAILLKEIERELSAIKSQDVSRDWNLCEFRSHLLSIVKRLCDLFDGVSIAFNVGSKKMFAYRSEARGDRNRQTITECMNVDPVFVRVSKSGSYVEETVYRNLHAADEVGNAPVEDDNGVLHLFCVDQKNNVLTNGENPRSIVGVILARSETSAKFLWENRHGVLCAGANSFLESLSKNQECVIDFNGDIPECSKESFFEIFSRRKKLVTITSKDCGCCFYEYFIPEPQSDGRGWLYFVTQKRLTYIDISILTSMVARIYTFVNCEIRRSQLALAYISSAIGSIMSRNGSHNIGSHVLAALSHNIGTMPDDRVLYQYIQHRMDYIATVTTESPSWAASTKFVGEMMRTFLSQRHLLEYIASSEGLHAYRFQDPNIDLKTQTQTIQIHVRYGNSADGNDWLELFSFDGSEKSLDHAKDVSLAIPGGVVGQHAFFTIIENVIRNAAKHGWSSKTEEIRKTENLEIYIDVIDDSRNDSVTFRIWDNMSEVKLGKDGGANVNAIYNEIFPKVKGDDAAGGTGAKPLADLTLPLTPSQTKKLVERFVEESGSGFDEKKRLLDGDKIPLHWRQQILMDQKIIKEDGSLRRENWGMAEMKISAGYLQRRTVGQIGGLDELEDPDDYIVRAITVPDAGSHRLGYEFKVPRPKQILIALKNDDFPSNEEALKKQGVYFLKMSDGKNAIKTWKEGLKTDAFAAEYLVIEDIKGLLGATEFEGIEKDFANHPFPFRILTCESLPDGSKLANMIPVANLCSWFKDGIWDASKILGGVLSTWRSYCAKRWGNEVAKNGVVESVNTVGESGSGQALISNADIWRLLFTEYFHSTLESFVINADCLDDLKTFIEKLKEKDNRSLYKFFIDEDWKLADTKRAEETLMWKLSDGGGIINTGDRDKILKLQYLDSDSIIAWQLKYLLHKVWITDLDGSIAKELDATTGAATNNWHRQLLAIYSRYQRESRPDLARLIQHFKQAFAHLDVMLRKYEERIVTLPKAFSPPKNDGTVTKDGNSEKSNDASGSQSKSLILTYDRHHEVNEANCANEPYVEPLSGSQSYLTTLIAYQQKKLNAKEGSGSEYEFLHTRLIENGLMRILFVDERVSRFLRNHEKSRYIYRAMNMWCVNEAGLNVDTEVNPKAQKGNLLTFKDAKGDVFGDFLGALDTWNKDGFKFDILIIHQGILDKWCKIASSVEGMGDIIGKLKAKVDYVVITTGRGTPANIPVNARILPFSTIEGTLFKLYPEKLTLVDSVMNILPLGGKRK